MANLIFQLGPRATFRFDVASPPDRCQSSDISGLSASVLHPIGQFSHTYCFRHRGYRGCADVARVLFCDNSTKERWRSSSFPALCSPAHSIRLLSLVAKIATCPCDCPLNRLALTSLRNYYQDGKGFLQSFLATALVSCALLC